jgi:hypothetical protein
VNSLHVILIGVAALATLEKTMTIASLGPRVRALKENLNRVYSDIGERTDKLLDRLSAADKAHMAATNTHSAQLDEIESGVAGIEDLARQMTNSPPDSDSTYTPRDLNGVSVNKHV